MKTYCVDHVTFTDDILPHASTGVNVTVSEHEQHVKSSLSGMLMSVTGSLCLIAGAVGVILPVIPSFPFITAALYFFKKSDNGLYKRLSSLRFFKQSDTYDKKKKSDCMSVILKVFADFIFPFISAVTVGLILYKALK